MKSAKGSRHASRRVGRGNASKGNYSGRGIKGQRARSGGRVRLKKRALMQQLVSKIPKKKGIPRTADRKVTVRIETLNQAFADGSVVRISSLRKKGIVKKSSHRAKIVAGGNMTKKLTIWRLSCSKTARKQIENAGGSVV